MKTDLDHSLTAAVNDGTISAEAAFCGLSPADTRSLAYRYPGAEVVVRLRSSDADSRMIMRAHDFHVWSLSSTPLIANGRRWTIAELRDVTASCR